MKVVVLKGEVEVATITAEKLVFGKRVKDSDKGMMETELVDDTRCIKILEDDGKTACIFMLGKLYHAEERAEKKSKGLRK